MEPRERFEAIFAAHYRDVLRYALRRTDRAHAEEVASEAFLDRMAPAGPRARARAAVAVRARPDTCWPINDARVARSARREHAAAEPRLPAGRDPAERFAERDAALRAFARLCGERDREALRLVAVGAAAAGRRGPRRGRDPHGVRDARPSRSPPARGRAARAGRARSRP